MLPNVTTGSACQQVLTPAAQTADMACLADVQLAVLTKTSAAADRHEARLGVLDVHLFLVKQKEYRKNKDLGLGAVSPSACLRSVLSPSGCPCTVPAAAVVICLLHSACTYCHDLSLAQCLHLLS